MLFRSVRWEEELRLRGKHEQRRSCEGSDEHPGNRGHAVGPESSVWDKRRMRELESDDAFQLPPPSPVFATRARQDLARCSSDPVSHALSSHPRPGRSSRCHSRPPRPRLTKARSPPRVRSPSTPNPVCCRPSLQPYRPREREIVDSARTATPRASCTRSSPTSTPTPTSSRSRPRPRSSPLRGSRNRAPSRTRSGSTSPRAMASGGRWTPS